MLGNRTRSGSKPRVREMPNAKGAAREAQSPASSVCARGVGQGTRPRLSGVVSKFASGIVSDTFPILAIITNNDNNILTNDKSCVIVYLSYY
jgi:hypothetical protein